MQSPFSDLAQGKKILTSLVLCGTVLAGAILFSGSEEYPELRELARNNGTDYEEYFDKLAREKGASYAFEILRVAPLPPGADYHLLGHAIGDELYKGKGIEGMAECTQEFRNACSHSVVVGAFDEFGLDALPRIRDACKKAPGGPGAYTMCFHGLGHGVLAYYEYELEPTIEVCKKTGTAEHSFREYAQCVGGAVMELGTGGGHDRGAWLAARERYFTNDPLSPCSTLILDDAKGMCYLYLTPRLFERAGADLARPQPFFFEKAFQYCDLIGAERINDRRSCFGGFGKEFIVLALDRDVREVGKADEDSLQTMWEWCGYAPHREALSSCAESVVGSLYWGGENAPDAALSFCKLSHETLRSACFDALYAQVDIYHPREEVHYRQTLCAQLPLPESIRCTQRLTEEKTL